MIPVPLLAVSMELSAPEAFAPPNVEAMKQAFKRGALFVGQFLLQVWTQRALDAGLDARGKYLQGLGTNARIEIERMDTASDAVWSCTIAVTNTSKIASIVEEGHAAFHMPSRVDWTRTDGSIKRTKKGIPYLSIPFRHTTFVDPSERDPGNPELSAGTTLRSLKTMMPKDVNKEAAKLAWHTPLRQGPIRGSEGQFLAADRYKWTDTKAGNAAHRLDRSDSRPQFLMGSGIGHENTSIEEHRSERTVGKDREGNTLTNPAWQNNKFHNLFRTGGPRHSGYMTIRTMTPDSPGWNIPARQGLWIARKVLADVLANDDVSDLFRTGFEQALAGSTR